MNIRTTKWQEQRLCICCDTILSDYTRLHSSGVCPYCGGKGPGAVTIVATKQLIYRLHYKVTSKFPFIHTIKEIK